MELEKQTVIESVSCQTDRYKENTTENRTEQTLLLKIIIKLTGKIKII